MATKKFLDSVGLKQVWSEVLKKNEDSVSKVNNQTDTKLKDYLKSNDLAEAIVFERGKDSNGADAIILKTKLGVEIGSIPVSEFVADGILSDVQLVNNELVFTFNADAQEKEIKVNLADYIDVYEAGDGISISDKTISVGSVGGSKVEVNAIQCGGTWLGDELASRGVTTISADNLQSVLETLFSQNTWPAAPSGEGKKWQDWNPRTIPASASASQAKPTITFSKSLAIVGETITVTASAGKASGSATVSYNSSAFPYGYSTANDNTKDADGAPANKTSYIERVSGEYSLTASLSAGFEGQTVNGEVTTSADGASLATTSLVVAKGPNTVTVNTSTPKYKITIPTSNMSAYWACSTLGKTSNDYKIDAKDSDVVYGDETNGYLSASNSDSKSVTGVYPIYTNVKFACDPSSISADNADGGKNAKSAWTVAGKSENVTKLTSLTNGSATFWLFLAFPAGGFTIKLPSGWQVAEVKTKSDTKDYVYEGGQSIITNPTEEITVAGTAKETYNVYSINADAGNVARVKITTK
jgi:hypothetical protein